MSMDEMLRPDKKASPEYQPEIRREPGEPDTPLPFPVPEADIIPNVPTPEEKVPGAVINEIIEHIKKDPDWEPPRPDKGPTIH